MERREVGARGRPPDADVKRERWGPSLKEGEPYVHWAGVRIAQLGYVNNLILGLAAGMVAFETSLIVGHTDRLHVDHWWIVHVAFGLAMLSVALGLATALCRLHDFRQTAEAYLWQGEDRQRRLKATESLGKWTWRLLWTQAVAFFLGVVALSAWLFAFVRADGGSRLLL